MNPETVRLATRGSRLAMAQADLVRRELETHRRSVDLVEVSTTGDELDEELIHELGTTGAFVRSLDEHVLAGDVDGAVHSMKDVPTEQHPDLVIAAIPPRGAAADVLVTPTGGDLDELPADAVVGTASLRRRAQVLHRRPDLRVEPVRGNVDTRLVKLLAAAMVDGDEPTGPEALLERARDREVDTAYDALVLARVGLDRLDLADAVAGDELDWPTAPGQGAIGVATRDDAFATWLNTTLDHPRSRVETTVERCILAQLGGGCVAPLAVDATIQGAHVKTHVQVLSRDGEEVIEVRRQVPVDEHVEGAETVADELRDRGAADVIEAATRDAPAPAHRD